MTTAIKTVADLKKEIQVFKSKDGLMPGSSELRESGVPVLYRVEKQSCDLELNVYENGLVFYRCGNHKTVFRLHKVPDSYYPEDHSTESHTSAEISWEFHLILYAEDKLFVNQENREWRIVTSIWDLGDDEMIIRLPDPVNRDPMEIMLRKEAINLIYSWVTELQAKVFRLVYEEKLTQKEVAARLGMSRAAVANAIVRIYETVRKHKNELF